MASTSNNNMVKNRAPAPIQITAEQILREASERRGQVGLKTTNRRITDLEELADYQITKRKTYEDEIRRQRHHLGTWLKYASWEASQKEYKRARSIFERAIEVDYKSQSLWLKYAEMEMKAKCINHARNIWDRAVSLLPRVDQFWYKYAYMEEMAGNVSAAREVFNRWMEWLPNPPAFAAYVAFEVRQGDFDATRCIYEKFLTCHPDADTFIKLASFEERKAGQLSLARAVYERGLNTLSSIKLYLAFAAFEVRCNEIERARAIYNLALENKEEIDGDLESLYSAFKAFERAYSSNTTSSNVLSESKRVSYEKALKEDPCDYDTWFDYIRLEEDCNNSSVIIELYERAVANIPPITNEKRYWKRYVYLWISYSLYTELVMDDTEKTREVLATSLKVIPSSSNFTFAKLWILAAEFEVRQLDISSARKILGTAVGKCPTRKLFKFYIGLESRLGNVDRVRILYQKFIEFDQSNVTTWVDACALEESVSEVERARGIYEIAVNMDVIDRPEVLWKAFIDFEIRNQEEENVRTLYERLLERTKHLKVWLSFATFESGVNARDVYSRADDYFKKAELKPERHTLLKAWLEFERTEISANETQDGLSTNEKHDGISANEQAVLDKMPTTSTKKRMTYDSETKEPLGFEEYVEYIFPDDEDSNKSASKLLQAAANWKKRKAAESN